MERLISLHCGTEAHYNTLHQHGEFTSHSNSCALIISPLLFKDFISFICFGTIASQFMVAVLLRHVQYYTLAQPFAAFLALETQRKLPLLQQNVKICLHKDSYRPPEQFHTISWRECDKFRVIIFSFFSTHIWFISTRT